MPGVLWSLKAPEIQCLAPKEFKAILKTVGERRGKYQLENWVTSNESTQKKVGSDNFPTNESQSRLLSDFCKPVQIHFVGRHGIRNPGHKDIETTGKLLEKLTQTSINRNLLQSLQDAVHSFSIDTEKELTETGWQELEQIGHRFGIRFSDIFQGTDDDDFTFQVTSKSRTVDSCKAFQSSLRNLKFDIPDEVEERNDLLRFFDSCDRYLTEVENRDDALKEYHNFRNAKFPDIGKHIVKHMGLSEEDLQLSPSMSSFTI